MKKILVPVDFSSHTSTVCTFAYEIARKTGGEIRLFHAYFDFMISTNTTFPYSFESNEMFNQDMMVKIRNDAKTDMEKLNGEFMEKIRRDQAHNIKMVYTLTGGLPEEEILNVSETYDPDLIVMGTRGKGEKDILTGKVSSKVVQNAKCRILTVPRDANYHGFENILYAIDFNDEDRRDLEKLIDLLSSYKPMIHCLHVDIANNDQEMSRKLDQLKSYFDLNHQTSRIRFEVACHENFLECVNNYVKEHKIDLIAVVHRRKSFLKRLFTRDHTRELLFHSDVPLYIFPGKE